MSRIGKLPVEIPEAVNVRISDGKIYVSGIKGELSIQLPREVDLEINKNQIKIIVKMESKNSKAILGTYRALIINMIVGVTQGWKKILELVGTGYRAELSENNLILNVGFSHPVEFKAPEGISFMVEKTQITIEGIDKELVGQVAAKIRDIRPPEPYKGKGIRYLDEEVRRKPGKAAKAQGTQAG
ncbi:50S ribosomal protein L6 [Candidatus Woesebacteria bacterium RBG_16_34_12]|uniref:Large ribosomal subunit protein uL6 n=1 Tax=Candidatus Woesebacteria bacterium RBG_16_34_12 TaxID=1802480 RepID=A0A1F7X9G5_9BACT|nr:MAG: 50S ribosomal protein L6 [Candidatus Woesebacteria bacterium RBG_16_34_12]